MQFSCLWEKVLEIYKIRAELALPGHVKRNPILPLLYPIN